MKKLVMGLTLLTLGSLMHAGGYRVSLQGIRQASLGAQGTTLSRDASVAFFNPAGLVFVESKWSFALGGFGVLPKSKYQNTVTGEMAETESNLGTPFYLAASYKPTKNIAVGLSVTTPYGNTVTWGNKWAGRYLIDEIKLKSFFIQPTVAYKFNDWLSVGAGFIYASGAVSLKRNVAVGGTDAQLDIESSNASGTGFNLGTMIHPHKQLSLGIAYRSNVKMKAENGEVNWKNVPSLVGSNLRFSANQFSAELPLVDELSFGINYRPSAKWKVLAEITHFGWSKYQDLTLHFKNKEAKYTSSSKRAYKDTFNYKLGVEYEAAKNVSLRAGYKFDESPSPSEYFSPETPTINYDAFTIGIGYKMGQFYIDAFGEYLKSRERHFENIENNFSGDMLTRAYIFGLGLTYNLGK